ALATDMPVRAEGLSHGEAVPVQRQVYGHVPSAVMPALRAGSVHGARCDLRTILRSSSPLGARGRSVDARPAGSPPAEVECPEWRLEFPSSGGKARRGSGV